MRPPDRPRRMRPGEAVPGPVIDIGEPVDDEPPAMRSRSRARPPADASNTRWLDVIGIGILTARIVTSIAEHLERRELDDDFDDEPDDT